MKKEAPYRPFKKLPPGRPAIDPPFWGYDFAPTPAQRRVHLFLRIVNFYYRSACDCDGPVPEERRHRKTARSTSVYRDNIVTLESLDGQTRVCKWCLRWEKLHLARMLR